MITQKIDFVGQYKVSKTCHDQLQKYIDKYEPFYLARLMGADLKALFDADLTVSTPQVPQTSPYTELFNPFSIDEDGCLRESEGILAMLVQFIYFHYVRDSSSFNTQSGQVQNQVEVSTVTPYNGYNLVESYNQGVKNFREIQWYILDNPTDYPAENIQFLEYISGI